MRPCLRTRLAAWLRCWLDLPGAGELAALRAQVRELRAVVTALAHERASQAPGVHPGVRADAIEHAGRLAADYMACRSVA